MMENNKKQSKVDGRDSYLIWKVPSARREDATTADEGKHTKNDKKIEISISKKLEHD